MYEDLKRIAEERSSEKCLELLRKITDLFLAGVDPHTTAETYLFNEIVDKIVDQLSRDAKVQVSANLAIVPGFPRGIVRRLASDADIEVARPVIRGSPVLTDDDFVEIAESGTQAYLSAIAGRDYLSERVTDVLIVRGERDVAHTVSANYGARLSESGMDCLLKKAHHDFDLRKLLVERPDLSQASVTKLLPLISEGLLIRLAERGYDVHDKLSIDALAHVREQFTRELWRRRLNIREVSAFNERVAGGITTLDAAMDNLIKAE
jgi:uncharacterized protein (DUF2336 family)